MTPPDGWRFALLDKAEVTPFIAYRGRPPEWARDTVQTVAGYTWWEVAVPKASDAGPGDGVARPGRIELRTASGTTHVAAGQWVLIPYAVQRRQLIAPGTVLTSMSFRASWPSGRAILDLQQPLVGDGPDAAPAQPEAGARRAASERIALMVRAICDVVGESRPPDDSVGFAVKEFTFTQWAQIRALLAGFLPAVAAYAREAGLGTVTGPLSGEARLDDVVHDMRRALRAGPLPYARWAALTGLGKAQLDRLALRHLGTTLRERRDVLLRDEIRHQLALGTLSAKELSARHHFTDAAHFSRWVRRMTGRSPRELRVDAA
ncbi:hypothetical protein DB346_09335 [Verrucomicrobia bacterium LW23]|nr:hypothetical protein DB346_09335 [Verrucomicrobia bacterium LW23]